MQCAYSKVYTYRQKTVKEAENMNELKEKLMEVEIDLIEETIAIAPTYQVANLLREYDPFIEELMTFTLRTIIKDIKVRRKRYEVK